MARFPPRPDVLCRVKMTRTAYAQLLGQKFYPPKIFGSFKEREGTAAWRWRDIGMKLVSHSLWSIHSTAHPDFSGLWIRDVVSRIQKSCRRREIHPGSTDFFRKPLLTT